MDPPLTPSAAVMNEVMHFDYSSPVAIAIAIAKKKKSKEEGEVKKSKERRRETNRKGKKKNHSMEALFEGTVLYALCLVLPALIGVVLHMYDDCSQSGDCLVYHYDMVSSYLCVQFNFRCLSSSSSSSPLQSDHETMSSLTAPDTAVVSDFMVIVILSWTFAFLRVLLVQMLVPTYLAPKQMEALVRCKSLHLLSSSYNITPKSSPGRKKPTISITHYSLAQLLPVDSELNTNDAHGNYAYEHTDNATKDDREFPPRLPVFDNHIHSDLNEDLQQIGKDVHPLSNTDVGTEINNNDNDDEKSNEDDASSASWWDKSTKIATEGATLFRVSSQRALGHESIDPYVQNKNEEALQDRRGLFAAPRYATAVFKLYYCIGICLAAVYWFRQANFWPKYLGGVGHTKSCWDLKGNFATSRIDTDFDNANFFLKYFFLVQASYHLHSLCFHLVSMTMLVIYGGSCTAAKGTSSISAKSDSTKGKRRMVFMKSGIVSYLRSLAQHMIAIVFVGLSYFFSSSRRLGAIGMFATDFSSIFLHLLQLAFNAPKDSMWSNVSVVRWIHRGLVVPSFL